MNLLCKFGQHDWKDVSAPFVGRRTIYLHKDDPALASVAIEDYVPSTVHSEQVAVLAPEETFYPSPEGPNHPRRECKRCHKQESFWAGRWA